MAFSKTTSKALIEKVDNAYQALKLAGKINLQ